MKQATDLIIDDLPFLDISLVTYNSSKWVSGFFKSLVNQDYPTSKIYVYIQDNHSNDDTVEACRQAAECYGKYFLGFELSEGENLGFGTGTNLNLSKSGSPYFLVSNIDLEFAVDAIRLVVVAAMTDDGADVASWELRQKPYEHPKWYDPVSLETSWSSSACILFRRSALVSVGGYEDRIFMYGEDVELSYRLRDHGFRLKYCPKAVCYHYSYEEAGQLKPLQFFGGTLANFYIRLRYGSILQILTGSILYLLLWVVHPKISGVWQGLWSNGLCMLRNIPYFLGSRKRSQEDFPICLWDYGCIREGSFHYCGEMVSPAPLVSVVTRTYQGRLPWLREAVTSVINQTYPNIELIVVEDGSDGAHTYLDQVSSCSCLALVVYRALPKVGRCKAGNAGLELATGEFVVFLDDDDLFFADHIEILVAELLTRPAIGATYALAYQVPTRIISTEPLKYEETSRGIVYQQPFSRPILWHHNYLAIQAVVFRRELYKRYGGFDETLENLEDWNLWTRYSLEQDFLLVQKATSLYRVPESQKMIRQRQVQLDAYYALAVKKQSEMAITLNPSKVIAYAAELSDNINAVVIPFLKIRNILVRSRWLNLFYYTAIWLVAKIRAKRS